MARGMLTGTMLLDADMSLPLWRDPRYVPEARLRQFEAHEQQIRLRERERALRRAQVTLAVAVDPRWSDEFDGCVE